MKKLKKNYFELIAYHPKNYKPIILKYFLYFKEEEVNFFPFYLSNKNA